MSIKIHYQAVLIQIGEKKKDLANQKWLLIWVQVRIRIKLKLLSKVKENNYLYSKARVLDHFSRSW